MNKNILFVCKGNSGRSQMAEAFFNSTFQTLIAMSAGIKPDKKIHPFTIKVMKETDIDMSNKSPKPLTNKLLSIVSKIIVLDSELMQLVPRRYLSKTECWLIEKLFGKSIEDVRVVRDKIRMRVTLMKDF